MKSTTRYTLVLASFLTFVILAPLLILYVSGRTLNFKDRDTNTTGLLDAKTNPGNAKLSIDDKDHNTTPAIVRFLKQGEYVIKLSKEGYYDWTKRLPIEAGKVTYAQEGVTEIQLIKKSEPRILVNGNVSSFVIIKDTIWFTSGNKLSSIPFDDISKQTNYDLNFRSTGITLLRDRNHLFLSAPKEHVIFDLSANQFVKIPTAINSQINDPNKTVFTPNGELLYVDENANLRAIDFVTGKNSVVKEGVEFFTMADNTAYFSSAHARPNSGEISLAYWNGSTFIDSQVVLSSIDSGPLYITDNKELFCSCGATFGRIGTTYEEFGPHANINLDLQTNELSYLTTGNELMFYNFLGNKPQLLTRGGLDSTNTFLVRSSIGYGFIGNKNGLEAIEIDSRDHQNRYQLIKGKPVWQIALTQNQKTILALVDGSIVAIDIRN